MTPTTDCPCGSALSYSVCCEPYILGKKSPPTALALMRARYSSYATGRTEFIEDTHAAESRADFDRPAAERWAKESQWKGLEIISTKAGAATDDAGTVEFVARFAVAGKDYEHRELASFRKEGGAWRFVDGRTPTAATFVRTGPEVGRNDPCSCGSGKKFKKCHGR